MTTTVSPAPRRTASSAPDLSHRPKTTSVTVPVEPTEFSPWGFARRHWLYLILCLLLSGIAADEATKRFTALTYNYEAQLLYNRIGYESLGYEPPSLTALTPILESQGVLEGVQRDLNLNVDLKTLSEAMTIEVPYESSLFRIKLRWPKPEQGEAVLNRIIDGFMETVAMTRNTSIGQTSGGLTSSMYEVDHKLTSIREQIQEFNKRHDILDLESDLVTLRTRIKEVENSLGVARHRHEGHLAQLASLTVSEAGSESSKSALTDAAKKAQEIQRWQLLRDYVSEEERRIQQQATLEFHEKEFERAKKLHEKKYISDAEFDAIAAKLKILRSTKDPSLEGIRDQLEKAGDAVPSNLKGGALAAGLASPEAAHRITTELSIIADDAEINHLQSELTKYQVRMDELIEARIESQSLDAELKTLTNEKARLQERQTNLQTVRGAKPIEFSVVQAAAPAIEPVKSNRKKLLMGVFGGCLTLLVAPVYLYSSRGASHQTLVRGGPV